MAGGTPERLPNPEHVVVEPRCVRDYLLNSTHPSGGAKSKFFTAYGFTVDDWDLLRASLMLHGRANPVMRRVETAWGTRYTVACSCETPDGRNPCIRTVWQMDHGVPRLLTAIPSR